MTSTYQLFDGVDRRRYPCIRCGQNTIAGKPQCDSCRPGSAPCRPPEVLEDARSHEEWTVEGTAVWPDGRRIPYSFTWRTDEEPRAEVLAREFLGRSAVREAIENLRLSHASVVRSSRVVVPT